MGLGGLSGLYFKPLLHHLQAFSTVSSKKFELGLETVHKIFSKTKAAPRRYFCFDYFFTSFFGFFVSFLRALLPLAIRV